MIRLNVSLADATVTETETLTAGRVGLTCGFTFSSEWDGLMKVAVFEGAETIEVALGTATVAVIPPECMSTAGYNLRIGAYGLSPANAVVIPTVWAKAGKIKDSAAPDEDSFAPATPELVGQIIAASESALAIARSVKDSADNGEFDGTDGFSPIANVSKSGGTATITITDKNGTTTASVHDGQDGMNGLTPEIFAAATTLPAGSSATANITGTVEQPLVTFGIPKGDQGIPGEVQYSDLGYVTPEMYGAKGDGTTDDTTAVQSAINTKKPVLMAKKYHITSGLTVSADNTVINCPGSIAIDSDITVFSITSSYNNIYVNKISGPDGTFSSNLWTFVGTAVHFDASAATVSYNTVSVGNIDKVKYAFKLTASATHGVMYNNIQWDMILAEYGVYMTATNVGWVNQNKCTGNRFRGNYGVKTEKGSGQTDPFNGNFINGVGFEGVYCAIDLAFCELNTFANIRTSESLNGTYWINLASDCKNNSFSTLGIQQSKINDLNSSAEPNAYYGKVTFSYNGNSIYSLSTSKTTKSSAGWITEDVMPASRKISITADGNQKAIPAFGLRSGWFVDITNRDSGLALVSIPSSSGYGYNGAEVVYIKCVTGTYKAYFRYGNSNIAGAIIEPADSGYYQLRYLNNSQFVLSKIADL